MKFPPPLYSCHEKVAFLSGRKNCIPIHCFAHAFSVKQFTKIHTESKSLNLSKNSLFFIWTKIHILRVSFLTKFTISKSHFSQNSHFSSTKFLVISGLKVSFCSNVRHLAVIYCIIKTNISLSLYIPCRS